MSDYTRCWCAICQRPTLWRYADDTSPNTEPECTEHDSTTEGNTP